MINGIGGLLCVLALSQTPPPTGEFRGLLKDKDGAMMKVAMHAPARPPRARELALLLVFHGMNGNENNYYGGMKASLERTGLIEKFVLICGKSKGPGWVLEDDGPLALRVAAWARESYPVDPRRVVIWGSSNGAHFIGRFGWKHQDRIAAAVGYCGGYNFRGEAPPDPAATRTEWYFVHGGDDNPGNSRRGCDQLKAMKYRYIFRQLDGYGHTDIWDGNGHPDRELVHAVQDDVVRWLDAARHKEIAPDEKDAGWLKEFAGSRADSLLRRRATWDGLVRIGGPAAAPAVLAGLKARGSGVRAAAARACARARFGPEVTEALAALLLDETASVRQAALQALSIHANWQDPAAVAGLIAYATTPPKVKGTRVAERALAVQGLGDSVTLAMAGNYADSAGVFHALVGLLSSEEAPLRAAAFEALKDADKAGFGYNPRLPADRQPDAISRWQAWCAKKCGPAAGGEQ